MEPIIRLTMRLVCGTGHLWPPRSVRGIPGGTDDSTILLNHFTEPIPRRDFNLHDLGNEKCPTCSDAASSIRFEATPGELK